MKRPLPARYPGLAVVAGASEGIGAAFAWQLARAGFDLLLVARRPAPLEKIATEIRTTTRQEVTPLALDLAGPDAWDRIRGAAGDSEIGLFVYNAAFAPIGRFADLTDGAIETLLAVNVATPLRLAKSLMERAIGEAAHRAIVIVSSMSGWQGGPYLAGYAASKAFLRTLGEALWVEGHECATDVVVSVPGATDTPGYRGESGQEPGGSRRPGVLSADHVARNALRSLGRRPLSIPGIQYKISAFVMNRLLPRRLAVAIMGSAGRRLL